MLVGHMTVPCRLEVIELHMGRIRETTYKRNITGWTRTLFSFDNEVDDDVRQVPANRWTELQLLSIVPRAENVLFLVRCNCNVSLSIKLSLMPFP